MGAQTNTFPSSGNVGIGTTSPGYPLDDVSGDARFIGSLHIGGSGVTQLVQLYDNATGSTIWNLGIDNTTGDYFSIGDGSTNSNRFVIRKTTGNVGIGTTNPAYALDVAGTIRSSTGGVIYPDSTNQTTAWTGVLCGGDYAESVDISDGKEKYEPGDLIVVDPQVPGHFLKSSEPYSTLVAGIYSTKPGVVGRRTTDPDRSNAEIPMAMVGIVPTKVSAENGVVRPGDLLVTSSTPGYAMKATDKSRIGGTIVGKALGSVQAGLGVIDVLVTLQ